MHAVDQDHSMHELIYKTLKIAETENRHNISD